MRTIVKINVTKQPTEYKNVFGTVRPVNTSGSGWVVDLKQMLQCKIPFVESDARVISESDEMINQKLISLGVLPRESDGKFLAIVTNMHVVSGFKSSSFQIEGVSIVFEAKILVTFKDRDLALMLPESRSLELLEPHDVSTKYIKRGESMVAYGYANGKQLTLSKGDLKRVMNMQYVYSGLELLAYEMTSPINPGDSGGPVCDASGNVIAVTHQSVSRGAAQNQSHSIPIAELVSATRNFLINGRDVGVLGLPIKTTQLLNNSMRKYYGAADDGCGVLVSEASKLYQSPFCDNDILLKINGLPINAEGFVPYGDTGEHVSFPSFMDFCNLGDKLTFNIIRSGKHIELDVTLTTPLHSLCQISTLPPDRAPRAFYRHGFAFIELNAGLITYTADGKVTAPASLYNALQSGRSFKKPELQGRCYLIVMSKFAEGYQNASVPLHVTSINEKKVRDIWHAQQIIDSMQAEETFVRVYCDNSETPTYILPRLNAEEEKSHRMHFLIPDQFESLHAGEKDNKHWNLVREKYKQGFFKNKTQNDEVFNAADSEQRKSLMT